MRTLLLALMLVACDEGQSEEQAPAPARAAADEGLAVAPFFPLQPGDRWRIEADDGSIRLEGVTGVDAASGARVVHGTGHVHAERFAASDEGVFLVTPEGRHLSPVLRAPLVAGARYDYALAERDVEVRCDVEVRQVGESQEVAGHAVGPCATLTRRCHYPAGAPFPTETTHTRDEVYCSGLGQVSERGVFRPAPSPGALAADWSERVVGYRVAGGPELPAGGCARYILLPSDVAAACGPDVRASEGRAGTGEERPSGGCGYTFTHGTAALHAVIGAPSDEAPETTLVQVDDDARSAWLEGPTQACRDPARLAPLLSSLLP